MNFAQATSSFWSRYGASLRVLLEGRSSRSEYWFIQLFLVLTNLAAAAIDLALLGGDFDQFLANGGGGIIGLVWILITAVPAVGVLIRRLHDTGRSGRWALIGLVPLVGAIVLLVFTVQDSKAGENKYGVSPKSIQSEGLEDAK